jgi:predicted SAM-dependent methyltransferase
VSLLGGGILGAEVNKIRDIVEPYLRGDGVDLGFGGAPVNETAICIDIKEQYKDYGSSRHLTGDARNLYWFKDGVLDYVFSSHLLEDFPNIWKPLNEWCRVLKFGGILALYLPDEQRYRGVLIKLGRERNTHHRVEDMSLSYMRDVFNCLGLMIEYEYVEDDPNMYGFLIIGRK